MTTAVDRLLGCTVTTLRQSSQDKLRLSSVRRHIAWLQLTRSGFQLTCCSAGHLSSNLQVSAQLTPGLQVRTHIPLMAHFKMSGQRFHV